MVFVMDNLQYFENYEYTMDKNKIKQTVKIQVDVLPRKTYFDVSFVN